MRVSSVLEGEYHASGGRKSLSGSKGFYLTFLLGYCTIPFTIQSIGYRP